MRVADAANKIAPYLTGDDEVYANPEKYFDQVIEIDLSDTKTSYKRSVYT